MSKKLFAGAEKLLFENASQLRKQPTYAEELLWQYLRQKPFGFKFRRQHPFGIHILDFYCHKLKLVIEVDGSIHDVEKVKQNDAQREVTLKMQGLSILRFTNDEVRLHKERVIQKIENLLMEQDRERRP